MNAMGSPLYGVPTMWFRHLSPLNRKAQVFLLLCLMIEGTSCGGNYGLHVFRGRLRSVPGVHTWKLFLQNQILQGSEWLWILVVVCVVLTVN